MRKGSNMVGGTVPLCQKATNLSSPSRLRTGVHSHEKRSRIPPMSSRRYSVSVHVHGRSSVGPLTHQTALEHAFDSIIGN